MKFKEKKITVNSFSEINKAKEQYMNMWVTALLLRQMVDKKEIDKVFNEPSYSKRTWRLYLFDNFGLEIIKHKDKIVITKHFVDKDSLILGEWKEPQVIIRKNGKNRQYDIMFDYKQIV